MHFTRFDERFERGLSLAMLITDASMASLSTVAAFKAIRSRKDAMNTVINASVWIALTVWRARKHRELLAERDLLLDDPYAEDHDDEEPDDEEEGWVFDREKYSGSDIEELIKAQVRHKHYPLMTVAPPPPPPFMSSFYLPYDDDEEGE